METKLNSEQLLDKYGRHNVREAGYLRNELGQELEVWSYDNGYGATDIQVCINDQRCGAVANVKLQLCPEDAAALRDMLTNALGRLDAVAAARAAMKNGGAQ